MQYLDQPMKEFSATDFIPYLSEFIRTTVISSSFVAKNNFDRYPYLNKNSDMISAIAQQRVGADFSQLFQYLKDTHYLYEEVDGI